MSHPDTREAIMAAGRRMVRSHGYSGLSFRELAKAVGVKSASIHYHFPTKGDLGAALARRYVDDAVAYVAGLGDDPAGLSERMGRYADIFRGALLEDNRMCLAGIMAAEHDDLPDEVRAGVNAFADANIAWLTGQLAAAAPDAAPAALRRRAQAIFAGLEGAQLVARGRGDVQDFDDAVLAMRETGLIP